MIKNRRQYSLAVAQLEEFRNEIASWSWHEIPDGFDPLIYQAQYDGMVSIFEELKADIAEYESLTGGDVSSIRLNSLSDLPRGLIKARIASGLTQRQLAELLGLKQQQIQRWEFEDYENSGFSTLVNVANALSLDVSEVIKLPEKPKKAISILKELGLPKPFIYKRFVPDSARAISDLTQDAEILAAASPRLEKIFGISVHSIDATAANDAFYKVAAGARFKIPSDADVGRVTAYASYAFYLANLLVACSVRQEYKPISRDWREARNQICGDSKPSFERLLAGILGCGILILPLTDSIRFHGACFRISGVNVLVLKNSIRYRARWAFDLLHELYHSTESPDAENISTIEMDPTSPQRRESEEEVAANEFAGNFLLNGCASEMFDLVLRRSGKEIKYYKRNVQIVAEQYGVDVGCLANYVAHRLNADLDIDWWGAAISLQQDDNDAVDLARSEVIRLIDFSKLDSEDVEILRNALSE